MPKDALTLDSCVSSREVHDPGQIHRYSHVILDEAAMGCGRDKSGTGLARVAQTARDLTGAQTLHEAA